MAGYIRSMHNSRYIEWSCCGSHRTGDGRSFHFNPAQSASAYRHLQHWWHYEKAPLCLTKIATSDAIRFHANFVVPQGRLVGLLFNGLSLKLRWTLIWLSHRSHVKSYKCILRLGYSGVQMKGHILHCRPVHVFPFHCIPAAIWFSYFWRVQGCRGNGQQSLGNGRRLLWVGLGMQQWAMTYQIRAGSDNRSTHNKSAMTVWICDNSVIGISIRACLVKLGIQSTRSIRWIITTIHDVHNHKCSLSQTFVCTRLAFVYFRLGPAWSDFTLIVQ